MRKRIMVEVEENQWAAFRGQAQAEGRFVRVVLSEALAEYLAKTARGVTPVEAPSTTITEGLRRLVAQVQAPAPVEAPTRPETSWERKLKAQAERERLRTHQEDESQ